MATQMASIPHGPRCLNEYPSSSAIPITSTNTLSLFNQLPPSSASHSSLDRFSSTLAAAKRGTGAAVSTASVVTTSGAATGVSATTGAATGGAAATASAAGAAGGSEALSRLAISRIALGRAY